MPAPYDWVGKTVFLQHPQGPMELVEVSDRGIVLRTDESIEDEVRSQAREVMKELMSSVLEDRGLTHNEEALNKALENMPGRPLRLFVPWNQLPYIMFVEEEGIEETS
jgi:hypothetical protein